MRRWLDRLLPSVSTENAVVFHARLEYGISQLLHSLDIPERHLIWIEVSAADNDIALGNKLAARVNQVFQAQLLSSFALQYNFDILQTLLPHIGPITLALTRAELAPEAAQLFLSRTDRNYRAVIQSENIAGLQLPENTTIITSEDLKLKQEEALELANNRLPRGEVYKLYSESQAAYDKFLFLLNKQLKLSAHLSPGPQGPRPLFDTLPVKPKELLKVLMRQRLIEALELAVEVLPEQVMDVLEKACHRYHENGLHQRLLQLLDKLSPDLQAHELVRYWRLQAAFRLGQEGAQRREVEAYLQEHEAPALRALAAGVFVPTNRKEALRAYKAEKTPFTAFQLGRLTYGKKGITLLKEAITLAEKHGEPYEIVRNMATLAATLTFQGEFQEGESWADQALKTFDSLGVQDGQRRLLIINDWAHARILNGNTAGLEPVLKENEARLSKAYPELAYLFRSTLADFYMATSQPLKAIPYLNQNLEFVSQDFFAIPALNLVCALLEINQVKEATKLSKQAVDLTKHLPEAHHSPALLAYGMTLVSSNPSLAQSCLLDVRKNFMKTHNARSIIQASLYLAINYFQNNNSSKARSILRNANSRINNLSEAGLRLLSGPESVFRPVWSLLGKSKSASLELRLLGKKEVWLEGKPVKLFPSWLEILAVLAIEQCPLTLEELMSRLYEDGGNKITLKSNLARMRQILPISQHPYHIQGEYRADFLDVAFHLKQGRFFDSVRLYGGPLLKNSAAPCIRAKDEELSEALCNYALEQNDIEALLRLSELLPDDLRLLDKLFYSLDKHDPRASYVKARVEQLRKSWSDIPLRRKPTKSQKHSARK